MSTNITTKVTTNNLTLLFLSLFGLSVLLFTLYPKLDLSITSYFYSKQTGFFLKDNPIVRFFYYAVRYTTISLILIFLGSIIGMFLFKKRFSNTLKIKIIYLALALAIGPGLVVNTIFKDQWGRARPHQIEEFGGTKNFTPAFYLTDQCEKNCSFASGHASMGFYIMAFAFVSTRYRKHLLVTGVIMGMLMGTVRIIQGAHFVSDVVFSGFFVFMTSYLLYRLMLQRYAKT